MNTCVYVYSNRTMMRWLKANLCILRLTGRHEHPSNTRISDNNNNNNSHGQHQAEADAGARPNVESTTDSELDDLDDDSQWLSSNPSLSAPKGVRRLASSTTAPGEEEEVEQEGEGYDEESGQVVNVLVAQQEQGQGGAGSDSSINRKSLGSLHSVKSILIGEKNAKNITKKKTGYFTDVDSEKFVRFGT